jgi:hypothetical protein
MMNFISKNWVAFSLAAVLLLSLCGCVVLAYLWIDRSITLSYANASVRTSENTVKNLELLVENEWLGLTKKQVFAKLKAVVQHHPQKNVILKEDTDGSIWFEEINFIFENDRLIRVR